MIKNKRTRGLVLFSGGLDSILAAKILQEQKIEITPLCFESYFFSCDSARSAAKLNGLKLRVENISEEHLKIVKNPRYGRGAAANPCIDCHLLMLKTAKRIMDKEGFDFIATGEVMGQRPMSQNRQSLEIIDRQSGLAGEILRPLSAKLMAPAVAETEGLVNRDALYGLSGRSRQGQLELAKKFGVKNIPQPGGGCILTDSDYGRRLKELAINYPDFGGDDAQILRFGRVAWENNLLIVIARDENDCRQLEAAAKKGDWLFMPQNFSGPTVLIRQFGKKIGQGETLTNSDKIKQIGHDYVLRHSKKIPPAPEISMTDIR